MPLSLKPENNHNTRTTHPEDEERLLGLSHPSPNPDPDPGCLPPPATSRLRVHHLRSFTMFSEQRSQLVRNAQMCGWVFAVAITGTMICYLVFGVVPFMARSGV
ncbi:uncharacterized protein BJX67DRAFT_379542 [Aspergillus lucknowensis]|uniref:Uncharacterized protein n=1 Tax=Aspergillus lucknowensis TaxID=176173 RepID=A0ABR4LWZ9_9EURO